MNKTAEEQFLRKKIRENYSVPENFYLQHFDYLNAEKVLHWLTEFSSSKDARIAELEEQVKFYEEEVPSLKRLIRPRPITTLTKLIHNAKHEWLNRPESIQFLNSIQKAVDKKYNQMKVIETRIEQSKFNKHNFVLVLKTESGKEFVLTGCSGNAYLEPYEDSVDTAYLEPYDDSEDTKQ